MENEIFSPEEAETNLKIVHICNKNILKCKYIFYILNCKVNQRFSIRCQ